VTALPPVYYDSRQWSARIDEVLGASQAELEWLPSGHPFDLFRRSSSPEADFSYTPHRISPSRLQYEPGDFTTSAAAIAATWPRDNGTDVQDAYLYPGA